MPRMINRIAGYWPLLAALAAGLMLAIAHGFETFGRYPPCELCLKQRDVYWAVLWIGLGLALLVRFRPSLIRPACAALALLFVAECAIAIYHAGVEWKYWPGPTSCTGGSHRVTVADMTALLSPTALPQHIVRCDEVAWRFLGLSMAGWNGAASLGLAAVSAIFVLPKAAQP